MKYIITESRLNSIIFKYLNNIDWEITDWDDSEWGEMTRLFFKNESQFPEDAIFESFDNEDCTEVSIEDDEECPTERVLLVNRQFYLQVRDLFGLTNIEIHKTLIEWYENYTEETIDDKSIGFID
jgi:hypothetical protein